MYMYLYMCMHILSSVSVESREHLNLPDGLAGERLGRGIVLEKLTVEHGAGLELCRRPRRLHPHLPSHAADKPAAHHFLKVLAL